MKHQMPPRLAILSIMQKILSSWPALALCNHNTDNYKQETAGTINDVIHAGTIRNISTQKDSTLLLNPIFALRLRRIQLTATDSIEDDVRDLIDLYLNGTTAARMPAPVGPAGFAA